MTTPILPDRTSSYLDYLPAIFRQTDGKQSAPFIGRLLLAFEKVLSGLGDPGYQGLEEIIGRLHTYFEPGPAQDGRTPDPTEKALPEFLPWLASWVSLSLREDWEEEEKRRFISRIVPLYRLRGTREGLIQMLHAYIGKNVGVEIFEMIDPLQIGVTCTVGKDTAIGGGPAHYFQVRMRFSEPGDLGFARREHIARAIIEQEKPAHTYFDLLPPILPRTMQVGVENRCSVGVSTFLGSLPESV